jgi:hypothetical protein
MSAVLIWVERLGVERFLQALFLQHTSERRLVKESGTGLKPVQSPPQKVISSKIRTLILSDLGLRKKGIFGLFAVATVHAGVRDGLSPNVILTTQLIRGSGVVGWFISRGHLGHSEVTGFKPVTLSFPALWIHHSCGSATTASQQAGQAKHEQHRATWLRDGGGDAEGAGAAVEGTD